MDQVSQWARATAVGITMIMVIDIMDLVATASPLRVEGVLQIVIAEVVSTAMIVLHPQEDLLLLSTLLVCMHWLVLWLGRPFLSPSCIG